MPTTAQQVQDAYHAITRKTLDNTTAQATADNINNGGQTFEQYVTYTSKLKSTMDSAGAVLKIFQILTGRTPDAASYDSIVATMSTISATYNVSAGYTAIGADLATWAGSSQFNALYKNVSVTDFVISAHQDVFGVTPGDVNAQIATYNIYKAFYAKSPIPADVSGDLRARGALLADFVHQANDIALRDNSTTFPWGAPNKYVAAEFNFQAHAVDGTAVYGGSLFTQPGYQSGSTLVLTAGVDNLTGTANDDLFDARVDGYLGSSDIINGGAGNDTIAARYTAAGQTVAPTLTSIENVFVRVDGGAGSFTFSAADATGLKALWASSTSGNNAVNFTNVAKTTVVGVEEGDGAKTINVTFTDTAGTTDAAALKFDDANVAAINVANIETLAIENVGTSTVAALNATSATALNISGVGKATLTDIDVAAGATIGITGSVNVTVDLDKATTVTAGAATGSITLTNVGAVAGNIVITTGSGADVLNVGANIANLTQAQDAINLGGGIDRVIVAGDIAAGNFARFSNYEEIEVTGNAARTIDMAAFGATPVAIFASNNGANNLTVNNFVSGTGITTRDDLATVSLQAGVGANAAAQLNLNASTADGVDITALTSANVQTLTINSLGGPLGANESNSVTVNNANDELTTINIIGDTALRLVIQETAVTTVSAGTYAGAGMVALSAASANVAIAMGAGNDTLELTGAAPGAVVIDLSSTTDQIVSVNGVANAAVQTGFENFYATSMTGAGVNVTGSSSGNTIGGSAQADTINGGAGDDIIDGLAGADTINAGEGADIVTIGSGQDIVVLTETAPAIDTLIWATAFAAGNANAATVTDFAWGAGIDVIDFQVNLLNGTTGATSALGAVTPVAVAGNGTATANDVIFTFNGAGDLLAAGTNIGNAVANAVTALTSGTDFSSANITAGDSLLLVMNDGTNTFVFHYLAGGTANVTEAGDLALVGMFNGVATVNVGDFI